MPSARKPYPPDVIHEERALVAPYLGLLPLNAPQRRHDLHEAFNGLPFIVKTGAPWRWLPHDFPPWEIVCQETQRWLKASVLAAARCAHEAMVHNLRLLLRDLAGRKPRSAAVIFDSGALQSAP